MKAGSRPRSVIESMCQRGMNSVEHQQRNMVQMDATYRATYRDRHGEERTSIHNDGMVLSMVVRGVVFQGDDFDSLEPTASADPADLEPFTLQKGSLCSCVIDTEIPVPVVVNDVVEGGMLHVHLELGDPAPNGGIDREVLSLELRFGDRTMRSHGRSGWFEDELLDIQRQLPEGVYMKACINCAFSDYSPLGHGLFGGMACFRDNKQAYLSVKSKADLFRVWNTMTEFVQETYLCPEFERRVAGTGYRG